MKMKIKEALQILEAAATDDIDDLKELFSSEYKHLRKALIKHAPHALFDKFMEAKDFSIDYPIEKVKAIDKSIRKNPWIYIGATSLLAIGLGFIIGKKEK